MRWVRVLSFVLAVTAVTLAWNVDRYSETFVESRRHAQAHWWGQAPSAPAPMAGVDVARSSEVAAEQPAPQKKKRRLKHGKRARNKHKRATAARIVAQR